MTRAKRSGLGKGLDALFMDNDTNDTGVVTLRLSQIEPNREQPRKVLLGSAQRAGRFHPRAWRIAAAAGPSAAGRRLSAGGRRKTLESQPMAGLQEVPVVIREMDEEQAMEIALIENLQREDLNAIEEASGYKLLMERYNMTQEQVAKRVGKSRPAIANALRLLNLPEPVLEMVEKGRFPPVMRALCSPLMTHSG